jgi:PKD repeat protein
MRVMPLEEGEMREKRPKIHWAVIAALAVSILLTYTTSSFASTEVTEKIELVKSRLRYDRRAGTSYLDVSLENINQDILPAPIRAVIDSISNPDVTVANPDGVTGDGKPYFIYDSEIAGGQLDPGAASANKRWIFDNPTRARFSYDVRVFSGPEEEDTVPPEISITNPIDNSTTTYATPYITIVFADEDSGINPSSFNAQINGADYTNSFYMIDHRATYQIETPLPSGSNVVSASISDNAGNTATAVSNFTIGSSTEPIRYIFSVEGNDWIFASPGDGTCIEYLNRDDLGLLNFSDIVALSRVTPDGDLFFTLNDQGGIFQSPADGSNSIYFNNTQLGLAGSDRIAAEHTGLDGSAFFAIEGQPDIYESSGASTNSFYMQNTQLGVDDSVQIGCLHIGYDDKVYFCRSDQPGVFESIGDGTNSPFLTASDLGVPGSDVDAFAILPETVPPTITITHPVDGAFLNTTTPNISISFSDADSGIDTSTFFAEINGTDMTSAFTVTESGATYQVPQGSELPVGDNTLYVEVQDRVGNVNDATSDFNIGILRALPGATPTSGPAPLTVYFSTDGEDPAGTIEVFRWDFESDGSWDTYDTVARDYTHIYNNPGSYNATLFVQSSTGETATETILISVENNPPVATADVQPSNGEVPLAVQMIGSGYDVDGSIVLYEWDFDGDGTFDWSSTTSGNTSFTYNSVGTYQAIFRVTDDSGNTATAVAYTTVIEANQPGSPSVTASATPTEGKAPLVVDFNGTATDPNNDVVLYEWDFDGDSVYDWSSTTSGSITHTYTKAGLHVARFRATDSTGLTASDQIGITVNLEILLSVTNDTLGIISDIVNLTGLGGVTVTASSTYESCSTYYPVSYLRDGDEYSYWMSAPGDSPNQGASTYVETTFTSPRTVAQINIKGGSYYSYYGITRARIELFDNSGNTLYSGEHDLPQDAQVQLETVENVSRFRLTALAANDYGGAYNQVSIAEIEILDSAPAFTVSASSIYDSYDPSWCKADNLFDPNNSWYSAPGDHPDVGSTPWIEVNFLEPKKISRVVVDESGVYGWRGVTRARIELLDATGTIIYQSEYDLLSYYETIDLPDIQNVATFKLIVITADNYGGYNYVSIYGLDILESIDGQYVSLVQKSVQDHGNYTASSEYKTNCYSYYPASNIIDGNPESYWLSAYNDTPNNGVNPVVEITFQSPQTVSQIIINGGSWFSSYGVTKARIELLDGNNAILYSKEHDLQALSSIDLPDISNVKKSRFTVLQIYYDYGYCSWGEISIYKKMENPEPSTTDVQTTISADTSVSIYLIDSDGNIVRTLVNNEFRPQGSYTDNWNLEGDDGFRAKDGVYYAVMEYVDQDGNIKTYDLTNTTGGTRYDFPISSGCDTRAGTWTENFSPFDDEQVAFDFTLCSAQEVTFFIGPLWTGSDQTRIRTILNRQPFGAGTHTIYWDGLDDNGDIAQAPSGDSLITGAWRYSMPDNAMYMTGGNPEISNVVATPNYYSPFSEKCDENGNGEGITIDYTVSEDVASVELRVYSIETSSLLRATNMGSASAGENTVFWDGKNNNGEYVDIGDYRIGVIATDAEGNQSMFRYALVGIDY